MAGFAPPHPLARLIPAGVVALALLTSVAWAVLDARARRAARRSAITLRLRAADVAGPELALHSASRWLRHPTRSEPWAASADGPAVLDVDPAGALAPPPAAVLRAGMPAVRVRHGRPGPAFEGSCASR